MELKTIIQQVLFCCAICFAISCKQKPSESKRDKSFNEQQTATNLTQTNPEWLPQQAEIKYSKHALCRMDCRHISKEEVMYILQHGKLNQHKSSISAVACSTRYAIEGVSNDNQHIRLIVAPCKNQVTVITCIDVQQHWQCSCPGDERK